MARASFSLFFLVQGYNDNSGLGPILSHYLKSGSEEGQALVLIINELGDNQMETYFNNTSGNNNGGMMLCEDERTDSKMKEVYRAIDAKRENSFKAMGGKYIKQEHTCAIQLPNTLFFEVCGR